MPWVCLPTQKIHLAKLGSSNNTVYLPQSVELHLLLDVYIYIGGCIEFVCAIFFRIPMV